MSVDQSHLTAFPPRPYQEVRALVKDGDILLCSATDPMSRIIQWATRSPWSHVAIAFRMEELDRVLVLEAVERIGVRCIPLSTFVSRTSGGVTPYPGQILLARHAALDGEALANPIARMSGFAFDRLGAPFSPAEIARIGLRILMGRLGRNMPRTLTPKNEYICSEYVAGCFQSLDLNFPWDGLGFLAPANIAAHVDVQPVAQVAT